MRNAPSTSVPSGVGELEVEGLVGVAEQLREQRLGGLGLGVAVAVLLHDRRVHAERHVVDEEPVVDRRVVDPSLDRVAERVDAVARVIAVDAEVEREVVPRTGRDADERHAALDGDRRDEGLGAVATRHPEAVRAPRDGVAGELLEIESVIEHHRLDTELVGQRDQTELVDLPTTRPRIADQHRVRRAGDPMGTGTCRGRAGPAPPRGERTPSSRRKGPTRARAGARAGRRLPRRSPRRRSCPARRALRRGRPSDAGRARSPATTHRRRRRRTR